ncbi:peptidase M23 [Sulfuricella sp. T08]|uniref:murein hydrolase activator EnvC family protein n=1 Tax=Sulfuricella sp. T08 TaxID=1632857 RepID=UPI0006179F38|nr:peptidoglycan DD-metalloendopeptidase family protein [Sulfuricella sp. T08]GAO36550.1 peptidase M23 [Sulfuricella sp. T08]
MASAWPARAIFLAVGLACAFITHAAPKDDLSGLRERIKSLQKEVESAEDKKTDATDALKQSEQAISTANRRLRELAQQQEIVSATLSQVQREGRDTQGKIGNQQALLSQLLSHYYLHGQHDPLKILLNQQDPNQLARQLHYYTYLSRARATLIESLRTNLAHSRELAQLYQEKSAELEQVKLEQAHQKAQLEKDKQARKTVLVRINQKITSQRHEIGRLQRDEKRLTQLIERLSKLAKAKKKKSAPLYNRSQPTPEPTGGTLHQLKGKLLLPVRGELVNRFGSQREDSGATWKGWFIKSAAGQDVKCIANGRVVFSDWLRGFGNIVIVDHGDDYMSLYGNNETLYKQAGEPVRAGDAVAAVGNSGGIAETGLYFEMRYKSRPFDPLGWVKLN